MEITLTNLAIATGLSVPHICMLIKRGLVPAGRKLGKHRLLPEVEARFAIATSKAAPRKPKGYKLDKPEIDWGDLI